MTTGNPQFDSAVASIEEKYLRLPIEQVAPSKTNPRTHFDDAYLGQLAQSIGEKGLIQPILVREIVKPKNGVAFEIIAGECRYRSSKLAAQTHIPAVVRSYTDQQVLELQLIENIHRKDLTALEQAVGYRALIKSDPDKHSAASIATRVGMSEAWVWDRLKLNDLIPEAKQVLERDQMTTGHAILLARLKPEDQKRAIAVEDRDGLGMRRNSGLWRDEHASLDIVGGDEAADTAEEKAQRKDKYYGLKPCSVRELETWIRNHVRFDVEHAAKAQPLVFEQTAAVVQAAAEQPGRGKKVIHITHEYRVADDARDADGERTYGSQSWQRADGKQKSHVCEHSVLGLVVAGEDQGSTLQVCVARDKCVVHFADVVKAKAKAAKQRESGKGKQAVKTEAKSAQKELEKRQAQQREREAWRTLEPFLQDDAIEQIKKVKTLTAKHAKAIGDADMYGNLNYELKDALGATWFKTPVAAWLVLVVKGMNPQNFDEFITEVAKPLDLDVKRLNAIRDKHQPQKDAAAPAKKKGAA